MLQVSSRAHLRTDLSSFVKATAALLGAAALLAAATPADAQMTRAAAVGVYRTPTNTFALDGNFDNLPDVTFPFGQANDVPLLGDLNGSGARGPVLYRAGTWLFDLDRDGVPDKTVVYGTASDVPLMGDIDGDGKEDIVLFRGGQWLVNTKADGTTQFQLQFGGSRGDIPLLGDVNGDGQVDLIIYNRGSWHVSLNQKNNVNVSHSHGDGGSEIPLVFDYNGDGKDDLVTYSAGVWSAKSVNGPVATGSFTFGTASDKPLYFGPGAFPNARLDAARFLHQATFGPIDADITRVQQIGYAAFVDEQFTKPHTYLPYMPWWPQNRPQSANPPAAQLPFCLYSFYTSGVPYNPAAPCNCNGQAGTVNQCQRDVYTNFVLQNELFKRALTAPDQLRHRVAWALSQILVTSSLQDPIAYPMRNYQQLLLDSAFGRFEDLLYSITFSPWMGNYLDMVRNDGSTAAQARGVVPNENYARELLQLFSIGLWELRPDGTLLLDAQGNPIPTYDQDDIVQLSRALTGWAYPPLPGQTPAFNRGVNYIGIMTAIEGPLNGTGTTNYHDVGAKSVMAFNQPAGTRAEPDVRWAVQIAANHPNTGVYIGRQLIQQLVTSNPSPAYVNRIVSVWNNNGAGVRGDLRAVVRAILLDAEARAPRNPVISAHGKLKEPVLVMTNLLRALGAISDGVYLRAPATAMGQNVYNAPTVFNYYQQDFIVPGTTLSGPPFQIFDATSYFARANFLYNLVYNGSCDTGTAISPSVCGPNPDQTVYGSTGTKVNWQPLKTFASDAAGIVDVLSMQLLNTKLPKAQRIKIINAVSAVPLGTPFTNAQLLDRVRMAAYLIAVSPQYQVEY
jgi:uncharacterized protein (DUF1800 family)